MSGHLGYCRHSFSVLFFSSRLYLINSPVVRAENLRFKEEGVRDVLKDVLLPWYNAYRFFIQNVLRLQKVWAAALWVGAQSHWAGHRWRHLGSLLGWEHGPRATPSVQAHLCGHRASPGCSFSQPLPFPSWNQLGWVGCGGTSEEWMPGKGRAAGVVKEGPSVGASGLRQKFSWSC